MNRFNYSEEELAFINNFNINDSKYWETKSPLMDTIKGKIRAYFLPRQNNECCYCKMLKQEKNGKVWNIEHVFPREKYPQFTFIPENLAISCLECNGFKLAQDVKSNSKPIKNYPRTGFNIKIIHPHFDDYNEHIKVTRAPDGKIFHTPINKSKKGRNTIVMCNLFRFQEEAFGKENNYQKSVAEQITKVLISSINQKMSAQELDLAIQIAVKSSLNY
ncbi:hypothetical protein ABFP31_00930 [Acinetobacter nosocomialis]|uniref:HNH endonuclease n=1 Tax=Acinetobacter nosocomialis TaxID=106654 RepID=UPI0025A9EBD5|nr:hypothetical protein [Acinetobacter nosocomialis]MDM9638024.1 hypothetical protein [Acinetobacter nosocomialis]